MTSALKIMNREVMAQEGQQHINLMPRKTSQVGVSDKSVEGPSAVPPSGGRSFQGKGTAKTLQKEQAMRSHYKSTEWKEQRGVCAVCHKNEVKHMQ